MKCLPFQRSSGSALGYIVARITMLAASLTRSTRKGLAREAQYSESAMQLEHLGQAATRELKSLPVASRITKGPPLKATL